MGEDEILVIMISKAMRHSGNQNDKFDTNTLNKEQVHAYKTILH